jgi:hypothetical protein
MDAVAARPLPAVARALDVYSRDDADAARQARRTLDVLLERRYALEARPDAWTSSPLTGDGFPVELSATTADRSIRYTVDPCERDVPAAERLGVALDLLERVGARVRDAPTLHALRMLQDSGSGLRWGAWIGGRHDRRGDRFKLYVEVPRDDLSAGVRVAEGVLGSDALLRGGGVVLQFAGVELAGGRVELYFRSAALERWQAEAAMRLGGVGERAEETLALYAAVVRRPVRDRLPGAPHGFSVSVADDAPRVFSLFTHARSVGGGDGGIRAHLLELARRRGESLGAYAALSRPQRDGWGWRTRHGMVAVVATATGTLHLQVGLRPTEELDGGP